MIVHIFNDQKKFSKGYFKMLKDYNFDLSNQVLFHYGIKDETYEEFGIQSFFIKSWFVPFGHLKMLKYMKKADKIIIHSLASPILLLYLYLFPELCKKSTWAIWGKDLYFYHLSKKITIFHKIYEFFRKRVFKRIAVIVSFFDEEYDLAKEWYGVTAKGIEQTLFYPYSKDLRESEPIDKQDNFNVMLGNSASLTNEHIEALRILKTNENKINKIYVPLSYGGKKKYAEKVMEEGYKLFGDKFVPMKEFIPFDEYTEILENIDIAVYNHRRQEALSNIYSLIMKGKTIYLVEGISTWKYFKRIGLKIGNINNIPQEGINNFTVEQRKRNIEILKEKVNIELSVANWKEILHE